MVGKIWVRGSKEGAVAGVHNKLRLSDSGQRYDFLEEDEEVSFVSRF